MLKPSGQHTTTTLGKSGNPFPYQGTDNEKWGHVEDELTSVSEAIEQQIAALGIVGWEMLDFEAVTPRRLDTYPEYHEYHWFKRPIED